VSWLGVAAGIAVGAALLVAGATKLARPSWVRDASALGVPVVVARPVPVVELAVGAGLVTGLARRPLAWVAVALLLAFTVVVARSLVAGLRPACAAPDRPRDGGAQRRVARARGRRGPGGLTRVHAARGSRCEVGGATARSVLDEYEAQTGRVVDAAAMELYRSWWDLCEVSLFAGLFHRPHDDDADTSLAWAKFVEHLERVG
jgi:hypothetical protein